VTYVTLGSPFAADCGAGLPRIWSSDSFNGRVPVDYDAKIDAHQGHVDILAASGCDIFAVQGKLVAPADGNPRTYNKGVMLRIPGTTRLRGIEDALRFVGIAAPRLQRLKNVELTIGQVSMNNGQTPERRGVVLTGRLVLGR